MSIIDTNEIKGLNLSDELKNLLLYMENVLAESYPTAN